MRSCRGPVAMRWGYPLVDMRESDYRGPCQCGRYEASCPLCDEPHVLVELCGPCARSGQTSLFARSA